VPSNSIERSTLRCGSVPTLICMRNRWWPSTECWNTIFSATCSASPTTSAPRRDVSASKSSRVAGGQPRSCPSFVITSAYGGKNSSDARAEVSATKPCELTLTTGVYPARRDACRYSSTSGANRSGAPPMIASAIGSPYAPARTADGGLPPTASHTGRRSWSGRGYTPRPSRDGRCSPAQVTCSSARSFSSSSSFSAKSAS
jgi:hypothetical protein